MIELVSIIILGVISISLSGLLLYSRHKHNKLIMTIAQLIVDKEALLYKIDSLELENSDEANEGFIKFLSDSREAAFTYIEDVQKSIQEYLDAVNSGNEDEILIARIALFNHLPESSDPTEE